MTDAIKVSPSPDRSTIRGILVPSNEGAFFATVVALAKHNGHSVPTIWAKVQLTHKQDGKEVIEDIAKTKVIVWEDGAGSIEVVGAFFAQKGVIYVVEAMSGNSNADAAGITLDIKRAA